MLEGGAVYQVAAFAPRAGRADLAAALGTGSAAYAVLGVGTIREAMITPDELLAYQAAWEQGLLNVRARPLIRVGNELSAEQAIALIRGLGARSRFGDDWLRIWGLKFVLDGGVEGGALEQPYVDEPANSGHLNWDPAVAHVRGAAERTLADTILVSGGYRQHRLPAAALLSEAPIAETEIHVLLDGLLVIEFDGKPVVEVGPGAIFDPARRTEVSKEHVTVRAKTPCRLAVLARDHLDSDTLLGVATEQISRLQAYVAKPADAGAETTGAA